MTPEVHASRSRGGVSGRTLLVFGLLCLASIAISLGWWLGDRQGQYPADFDGVVTYMHAGHLVALNTGMEWQYHSFSPNSELLPYDISCSAMRIAYGCIDAPLNYSIEVRDLATNATWRLQGAEPQSMCFSPNGQRLAFFGAYNGRHGLHVWDLTADVVQNVHLLIKAYHAPEFTYGASPVRINWMGEERLVVESRNSGIVAAQIIPPYELIPLTEGEGPSLSPDGTMLVYSQDGEMWQYDIETGQKQKLGSTPIEVVDSPVWTPDSRYIVYVRDMNNGRGWYVLYAMQLSNGAEHKLKRVDGWYRDLRVLPIQCLDHFERE